VASLRSLTQVSGHFTGAKAGGRATGELGSFGGSLDGGGAVEVELLQGVEGFGIDTELGLIPVGGDGIGNVVDWMGGMGLPVGCCWWLDIGDVHEAIYKNQKLAKQYHIYW
jgi:hypothetical protein